MTIKHIIQISFQKEEEAKEAMALDKATNYIYEIRPDINLVKPEIIRLFLLNEYIAYPVTDFTSREQICFRHKHFNFMKSEN